MQKYLDEFWNYLKVEKQFSQNTLLAYRNDLSQFCDFLTEFNGKNVFENPIDLPSLDILTIRGFANYLHRLGLNKSSMGRKLAAVRTFSRFLCKRNYLDRNSAVLVPTPKLPKKLVEVLQPEEVTQLLESESSGEAVDVRDLAIWELLYATGLRVGELSNLKTKQINLRRNLINIVFS